MNILNSFKKIFFKIDNLVFNSFFRRKYNFIKYNLKLFFVIFFKGKKIISKDHGLKKKLIISLTSYPGRFRTLPLVLNSIEKPCWEKLFLMHLSKDCNDIQNIRERFSGFKKNGKKFTTYIIDPSTAETIPL